MREARKAFAERNIEVTEALAIGRPKRLVRAVRALIAHQRRLIVIAGGDGTLGAVSGLFAYQDSVLGILPIGTGNSFARTLNVPLSLEGAIETIVSGTIEEVDLGRVNDAYFANSASIGLSAEVAGGTSSVAKKAFGAAAYLLTGAFRIISHRPFRYRIVGGRRSEVGIGHQVIVANGSFFGTNPIGGDASVRDGRLRVFAISGSRWQVALMWLKLLFGQGLPAPSRALSLSDSIHVEANPSQRIEADGEVVARTPASFSLARGALRVFVGPEFRAPCT